MAYEELPMWLKPGIVEWNASSIKFDNGCKISAEATSGSSGRGGSCNVLICDEFAFLKSSLESEFLQSVFPVVSSSKTSKIILVSTPNGMGNEFYRTWNRTQLRLNEDPNNKNLNWKPIKIDWWEVPGRDEHWKKIQLESFNGDENKFLQEYGNCLGYSTKIKIFNIEKNKEETCSIGELYYLLLNKINVKNYLIETPNGYKSFLGVTRNIKNSVKIIFNDESYIECSDDHPFVINDKIIRVNQLKVNDYLCGRFGLIKIKSIINIGERSCFDIINVDDNHVFYANNIITHNSFLGSAETLISAKKIRQIKDNFSSNAVQPYEIQLHNDFPKTKIKLYEPPIKGHAYIVGADPSLGSESDYHSMVIFDITNAYKIKQVAGFYENDIPPKTFAYILAKAALLYNSAYVAIENNGCSEVVLDALWRDFDYDNIINEGGNIKTNIGIHSTNERKTLACIAFKAIVEDDLRTIQINDGRLIAELEKFERKSKQGKMPTYCAADGHDDYMMSAIWALYCLQLNIIENYYDVKKTILNKLGEQLPIYIMPFSEDESLKNKMLTDLDEKFKLFNNEFENKLDNLNENENEKLIDEFIKTNNLKLNENEDEEKEKNEPKTDQNGFLFTARFE